MWDPLRAVYSKWDDAGNVQDSIIPDVHINPEALICAQADPAGGLAEERCGGDESDGHEREGCCEAEGCDARGAAGAAAVGGGQSAGEVTKP